MNSEKSTVVGEDHVYITPVKLVKTVDDMQTWDKSEAYFEYLGFILAINESIKGKNNTEGSAKASDAINKVVGVLDTMSSWIDEIPPVQQPQRFGNQAFKTWHNKLKDVNKKLNVADINLNNRNI